MQSSAHRTAAMDMMIAFFESGLPVPTTEFSDTVRITAKAEKNIRFVIKSETNPLLPRDSQKLLGKGSHTKYTACASIIAVMHSIRFFLLIILSVYLYVTSAYLSNSS